MKNISIAIIDDEKAIRQLFQSYVDSWATKRGIRTHVRSYESAESFLFQYEDEKDVDVILLDIEMKNISGVDLAKKLRESNDKVQIIFISGYSEYIGEGYDVNALHFLVKPIKKEKLWNILDKAVSYQEVSASFIILKTIESLEKIYLSNIICAQADKNYINIFCEEGTVNTRMTMKEMESKLDERFYRLDRSTILNIEHIDKMNRNEITLSNGIILQIPRGRYKEVNRKIIDFF